jgi:sterol desaturase/sphingolipid hydroxylase (fatty acid hydroxylase superfamily)
VKALDINSRVSSETFGNHKLHNQLVLCPRKDWSLAAIIIIAFYLLILYLLALSNTPKNPFASIYSESLIKTACQHLLLLVGFDILIYRKYYDTPHILVGHQQSKAQNHQGR